MQYVVVRITCEDKELFIVKEKDILPGFQAIGGVYESEEKIMDIGGYIINVPSLTLEVTAEEFAKWEKKRIELKDAVLA